VTLLELPNNYYPEKLFSSLAVGFVTAGAKRLLITLWPVTDEIAANVAATYLLQNKKYPYYCLGRFLLMGD